jgi:hypothetical protein
MFIPLGVKTDYSLLQSLIKVKDLIAFLKKHNITACSILDNNLYGVNDFYFACLENVCTRGEKGPFADMVRSTPATLISTCSLRELAFAIRVVSVNSAKSIIFFISGSFGSCKVNIIFGKTAIRAHFTLG